MATLTPKQAEFVRQYLIDLNATQAAIRAGYSARGASTQGERLLRNVEIQKFASEQMAERAKRTGIDADYVLNGIQSLTALVADPEKPEFDPKAAFKGYELLGKHLKLFTDKTEITGANGGPIAFDGTVKVSFADAPVRPDDTDAPGSDPAE